ncbi:uncharacterized protein [Oscarella lobularis]|uniref:uncharacterized protein n=1 Tax=Oscarella lobularis TaxID=121494 RepID=UPI0033139B97
MGEPLQKLKTRYVVLLLFVVVVGAILMTWRLRRNSSPRRESDEKSTCSFDSVRYFVLFVGTGRSGHSLVSALLDAHPHVIISDEYDLLSKWPLMGVTEKTRDHVFNILYEKSHSDSLRGRGDATNEIRTYTYHVPNEYPGQCGGGYVEVIGDKKGTGSARFLADTKRFDDVRALQRIVGVPLKILHVVRNPFDTISTQILRSQKIYEKVKAKKVAVKTSEGIVRKHVNKYFGLVDSYVSLFRANLPKVDFMDVWSEDFIRDPKGNLRRLCTWFEIECSDSYLDHCASIVSSRPSRTRELLRWPFKEKLAVEQAMKNYSFFRRYSF